MKLMAFKQNGINRLGTIKRTPLKEYRTITPYIYIFFL